MTTNRELTDRELWQSLAAGPSGMARAGMAPVSDSDLAAWLEGRLPEADAARVDAAITADPALRAAALELSEILGQPLPAAPERLVVRAKALVGFEAEEAKPRGSFLSSLLGWRFAIQRAAVASLAVMIAITGFMMGGGLGSSYAQDRQGKSADRLSELSDIFSNDGGI